MERKEILPYFVYIVMISGAITQWISNENAKITSYYVILVGVIFSLLLTSVALTKGKLGIGTVILTYLLFILIMAILGTLIYIHTKYGKKLQRVDDDGAPDLIRNYEIYVRLLIIMLIVIIGKITDDAVKGKLTDVYKLSAMTSFGWLISIFGGLLVGQMYVVVSRFLTDGFKTLH
jgi:small-conductance mechanosensitive channel